MTTTARGAERRDPIGDSSTVGRTAHSLRRPPRPVAEEWEWQAHGHCRRWPTDVFFPEDQGRHGLRARELRAKQICVDCPVLAQCRNHALATPELNGIWAATTPRERMELIAQSVHHRA